MGREFTTWRAPGDGGLGSQITSLNDFSPDVLGQLRAYFEQSGPKVPITQQSGAQGQAFSLVTGTDLYSGTCTTKGWADLDAGTGSPGDNYPKASGLGVGRWLFVLSGVGVTTSGSGAMTLLYNGVTYEGSHHGGGTLGDKALIWGTTAGFQWSWITVDVVAASSTIKAQYEVSTIGSPSLSVQFCRFFGIRYANLSV